MLDNDQVYFLKYKVSFVLSGDRDAFVCCMSSIYSFPFLMHLEDEYNWCLVHLNASGRLNVELPETASESPSLYKVCRALRRFRNISSNLNFIYNVKNNPNKLLCIVLFSLARKSSCRPRWHGFSKALMVHYILHCLRVLLLFNYWKLKIHRIYEL